MLCALNLVAFLEDGRVGIDVVIDYVLEQVGAVSKDNVLMIGDRKHDIIYLLDEIYKKHLSNNELAEMIKSKQYDFTGQYTRGAFYEVYKEKQMIICDSAEPKSINDLRAAGLKCMPCKKYPGSVIYGVKWLQNRHIVIDPRRTPSAYKEFTSYEYETTKDGEFLADVPDRDNHTIDAVRYALDMLINYKGVSA